MSMKQGDDDKVRFKIRTLPFTNGIIANDGHAFLGITAHDDERVMEQFVLYDLDDMMTIFTLSDVIMRQFPIDEIIDCPMAKSDKGELFIGRYIVHTEENSKGYKIEGYDLETGSLRTVIPISEYVDEEWSDHRVADVIRIDQDRVMIACYDDGVYPGAGYSVYLYNSTTDEMWEVASFTADAEYEDEYFFNLRFDRTGEHIYTRISDDLDEIETPTETKAWHTLSYDILDDYQNVELSEDQEEDTQENFFDMIDSTIDIDENPGGLLKKGHLTVTDKSSKAALIDEELDRNDYYNWIFVQQMDMIIFVVGYKSVENAKAWVIHYDGRNWNVLEELLMEELPDFKYDDENDVVLLKDIFATTIIKRTE